MHQNSAKTIATCKNSKKMQEKRKNMQEMKIRLAKTKKMYYTVHCEVVGDYDLCVHRRMIMILREYVIYLF